MAQKIHSLTDPDLSGLWSVSHLPGASTWWGKAMGSLPLLALTSSWVLGMFIPLYAAWLLTQGGASATLGAGLGTLLAWPFVVTVKPWPRASRWWLTAHKYFAGGCSMAFEKRTPNDTSIPYMQCYHPHGIFTLVSGCRCAARTGQV